MIVSSSLIVFLIIYSAVLSTLALLAYFSFSGRHAKQLTYEVVPAGILESRPLGQSMYAIAVISPDATHAYVPAEPLVLTYLRLTNPTRAAIFDDDFMTDDPLRLEIHGSVVVDITVVSTTNPADRIRIGTPQQHHDTTTVPLIFHHLSGREQHLIQIMTKEMPTRVVVGGTLGGMAEGLTQRERPTTDLTGWVKLS